MPFPHLIFVVLNVHQSNVVSEMSVTEVAQSRDQEGVCGPSHVRREPPDSDVNRVFNLKVGDAAVFVKPPAACRRYVVSETVSHRGGSITRSGGGLRSLACEAGATRFRCKSGSNLKVGDAAVFVKPPAGMPSLFCLSYLNCRCNCIGWLSATLIWLFRHNWWEVLLSCLFKVVSRRRLKSYILPSDMCLLSLKLRGGQIIVLRTSIC
jgi:hypothetical protein